MIVLINFKKDYTVSEMGVVPLGYQDDTPFATARGTMIEKKTYNFEMRSYIVSMYYVNPRKNLSLDGKKALEFTVTDATGVLEVIIKIRFKNRMYNSILYIKTAEGYQEIIRTKMFEIRIADGYLIDIIEGFTEVASLFKQMYIKLLRRKIDIDNFYHKEKGNEIIDTRLRILRIALETKITTTESIPKLVEKIVKLQKKLKMATI